MIKKKIKIQKTFALLVGLDIDCNIFKLCDKKEFL